MSSPERRLMELNLDAAEAEARSISKMYGGRLSVMTGGINLVAGGFVTDCLLHISGKAEHMSTTEQCLVVAAGGLAAAAAVLRKGYKSGGTNLVEVVQWRQEHRKAVELGKKADELASWFYGPGELTPVAEAEIDQFRAQLDVDNQGPIS